MKQIGSISVKACALFLYKNTNEEVNELWKFSEKT